MNLSEYIEAGKALDADSREIAVLALQHEEPQTDEFSPAWMDEIHRRVDQIVDGEVELLDFEESHRRLRQELGYE